MIRTWAVWERSKVIGLILFTEAAIAFVAQLYLTIIYAKSLTCKFMTLQRQCTRTLSKLS